MRRICKYCGAIFDGDPAALGCPDCVEARRHDTIRPRVCRTCGAVFDGGPRAWYCPACRTERRRQHDREAKERKRAGMTRALGSTDLCVVCGKPYVVMGGLQRYCPDCAPEAVAQIARAQSLAYNRQHYTAVQRRQERKSHAAYIPCAVCGNLFRPSGGPAKTCSDACAEELKRRWHTRYTDDHRAEIYARHNARTKAKEAAMTPEEYRAYRDKINARARENYARRKGKKEKTPED